MRRLGNDFYHYQRVYDPIDNNEGVRVLVDASGLGASPIKRSRRITGCVRSLPTISCVYGSVHDPNRWDEFKHRYLAELHANPEIINFLLELGREKGGVLLFSTRDLDCNQVIALQQYRLSLIQNTKGANQANGR